ncbi:hypothetical protein IAD21_01514 [Abditibacteriota bacterium]|nr:hypothetical protein IAD21_01514 [Abditibacteriota bacterium]
MLHAWAPRKVSLTRQFDLTIVNLGALNIGVVYGQMREFLFDSGQGSAKQDKYVLTIP